MSILESKWDKNKLIKELQAEMEEVKRCNKTMDGILLEREEELKELRNSKIEVMTKAQEEIRKLKADIKHFKDIANEDFKMIDDDRDKLQAENKRLNDVITLQNADIIQAERSN